MKIEELEKLVKSTRGMDPSQALSADEAWDSLDHLAIVASLTQIEGAVPEGVDLSEANSIRLLSEKICK